MTTYAYGGFPFNVDLSALIEEATQVHARTSSFKHLGTTAAIQNQRLSEIINRGILAVIRAMPGLGMSYRHQLTTVANQGNYSIPEDLQGLAISYIQWDNTGTSPATDTKFLRYLNTAATAALPVLWRNGTYTVNYPSFWSLVSFAANKTALTGTVEVTNGDATVTGTDTLFTTQVAAGDVIEIYGLSVTVLSVTNPTHLELTTNWGYGGAFTGEPVYLLEGTPFTEINLWPIPATAGYLLNVLYQIAPTQITADMIANRDTTPIAITEIPTEFQDVLAMQIAIHMLTLDEQKPRKAMLMQEYPLLLQEAQHRIGAPEASDNPLTNPAGDPSSIANDNQIFGGMFNFGVQGVSWT